MASGITPARRLFVRTSLVTGSTLALVVGAQSLITLDLHNSTFDNSTSVVAAAASSVPDQSSIISAAPSIVILRHPSVQTAPASSVNPEANPGQQAAPMANAPLIQPPAPIVVQPQAPVIVQAPAPSMPVTHSTR